MNIDSEHRFFSIEKFLHVSLLVLFMVCDTFRFVTYVLSLLSFPNDTF